MEHVHVHMYGTTFSARVLWRNSTESHRVYEPPVLLYFSESWSNSCMTAHTCTTRDSTPLYLYERWRNTGMVTLTWTAWDPRDFVPRTGHGVSIVQRVWVINIQAIGPWPMAYYLVRIVPYISNQVTLCYLQCSVAQRQRCPYRSMYCTWQRLGEPFWPVSSMVHPLPYT